MTASTTRASWSPRSGPPRSPSWPIARAGPATSGSRSTTPRRWSWTHKPPSASRTVPTGSMSRGRRWGSAAGPRGRSKPPPRGCSSAAGGSRWTRTCAPRTSAYARARRAWRAPLTSCSPRRASSKGSVSMPGSSRVKGSWSARPAAATVRCSSMARESPSCTSRSSRPTKSTPPVRRHVRRRLRHRALRRGRRSVGGGVRVRDGGTCRRRRGRDGGPDRRAQALTGPATSTRRSPRAPRARGRPRTRASGPGTPGPAPASARRPRAGRRSRPRRCG